MNEFTSGPFVFAPGGIKTINGQPHRRWALSYGAKELAERYAPAAATQDQVREIFSDDIVIFTRSARERGTPDPVILIDQETGDPAASFRTLGVPDMTPGLIDDRSKYWLRSLNRLYSRPVTLPEFTALAAKYTAPENAWMTVLLPESALSKSAEEWRAPTSWELRHIVGEGSFTHISGAKAAALVGVSPQNFRKYTASDNAKNRQSISFSMWHLLLYKLGVQL